MVVRLSSIFGQYRGFLTPAIKFFCLSKCGKKLSSISLSGWVCCITPPQEPIFKQQTQRYERFNDITIEARRKRQSRIKILSLYRYIVHIVGSAVRQQDLTYGVMQHTLSGLVIQMIKGTELIVDLFKKLNGLKPTRVKQGHGSFITIHFGRDLSEEVKTRTGTKTRYYGEWRLWVYMCAWRIDINKKPCAGSEDSREKIENCLTELAQRELNMVIILNDAFDATLFFGNDVELHLFSFHTEEREQWKLFTPEKKVFIAGPGNEWSYRDSDKPPPSTSDNF